MRLALAAAAIVLPAAVLAAPPPELVFTVCRADDPAVCHEERIALDDPLECLGIGAQSRVIHWLDEHPKWSFGGRYSCAPAERGA